MIRDLSTYSLYLYQLEESTELQVDSATIGLELRSREEDMFFGPVKDEGQKEPKISYLGAALYN